MRQPLSLEEALDINATNFEPGPVELEKTPNFGNIVVDPNWTSPLTKFDLGLFNDKESVLSDLIAKKLNKKLPETSLNFKISDLISSFMTSHLFLLKLLMVLLAQSDTAIKKGV